MPKTNKNVSTGVMNILKSVMDSKVVKLRTDIDAGARATQEERDICERISSLQRFIDNNRYDRSDTIEAEQEIAEYESQASAVRAKINRGNAAVAQMVHADKFYATYKDICNKAEIRQLQSECTELENRLTALGRNMESCEINMTPNLYGVDIADQSRADYEHYSQEYDRTYQQLQNVLSHIKSLQK